MPAGALSRRFRLGERAVPARRRPQIRARARARVRSGRGGRVLVAPGGLGPRRVAPGDAVLRLHVAPGRVRGARVSVRRLRPARRKLRGRAGGRGHRRELRDGGGGPAPGGGLRGGGVGSPVGRWGRPERPGHPCGVDAAGRRPPAGARRAGQRPAGREVVGADPPRDPRAVCMADRPESRRRPRGVAGDRDSVLRGSGAPLPPFRGGGGRGRGVRAPRGSALLRSVLGKPLQQRRPDLLARLRRHPELLPQAPPRPLLGAHSARGGVGAGRPVAGAARRELRPGRGAAGAASGRRPRDRGIDLLRDHVRRRERPGLSAMPGCS